MAKSALDNANSSGSNQSFYGIGVRKHGPKPDLRSVDKVQAGAVAAKQVS